jgi:hypothetical protein
MNNSIRKMTNEDLSRVMEIYMQESKQRKQPFRQRLLL